MKNIVAFFLALFALSTCVCADMLPEGLDAVVPGELLELADGQGENLVSEGARYLLKQMRLALRAALFPSLRAAASLLLLALLCGLAEGMGGSAGDVSARYTPYLGVLGAAALSAGEVQSFLALGVETVQTLGTMAKLLLPTVASAMAAGGAAASASVWQVGALWLSDVFLSLLQSVFVPLIYCMVGVETAGALLPESRLSLLSEGIGKLLSRLLGAVLFAFTLFLSLTNILSGSADRLAVQLGKSVVSGAVPIVGGILSDATGALLAGAHALRGTLGTLGVLAVLGICIVPLVRLGMQYLLYRVSAFFCALLGSSVLCGFLERLAAAFSLMLAMTAGGAFLLMASLLIALLMVVNG